MINELQRSPSLKTLFPDFRRSVILAWALIVILLPALFLVTRVRVIRVHQPTKQNPQFIPTSADDVGIYSYRPRKETNNSREGKQIILSKFSLASVGFPLTDFQPVTQQNVGDFVFVTAASDEFKEVVLDAIARVQKFMPGRAVLYYDISRTPREDTRQIVQQLCYVEYRRFNFSKYPEHLQIGQAYAWKPVIVHEVLRTHNGVFWIDSSIRLKTGMFSSVYEKVMRNGGILTFSDSSHSIFSATHYRMFDYLPLPRNAAIAYNMMEANSILIYRSREIYEGIMKWWFLCALYQDCMAPTRDLNCNNDLWKRNVYAHCHRYDQSALGILALNHFVYKIDAYLGRPEVLSVERRTKHKGVVSFCRSTSGDVIISKQVDTKHVYAFYGKILRRLNDLS